MLVGCVGVAAVVRYHYPEFRAVTWVSWVYLTYRAAGGVWGMWDVDDWPRDGRAALALGFVLVAADGDHRNSPESIIEIPHPGGVW